MKRLLRTGLGLALLLVLSVGVASADLGDRVLSLGSSGSDVVELQQSLTALGYPVPATGYYGTMTRRAIAAFQWEAELPVTGRADGTTIQELEGRLAESETFPGEGYDSDYTPFYGDAYTPYAAPRSPYQAGPSGSYGPGSYGWGTPMGPGMMGGGMMGGGMMGGGWGSRGSWGPGTAGGGWGGSPFGW